MKRNRSIAANFLAFVLAASGLIAATPSFRQDCEALLRDPHRLSGTPEMRRAADYVIKRLEAIGPDELIVQPFSTTQTQLRNCSVTVNGRELPLLPMRPNGIVVPATPEEGITGKIVHVGKGTVEDFSRKAVRNAIVVMDYNTGETWLRAFRLGAEAVIFTRSSMTSSSESHYVENNANLPRYFYQGPETDFPEDSKVTINASLSWEWGEGRNLIAYFKGTDPIISDDKQAKEELIIVSANLDSFGEIPRLSPGARGAANCAGLLKIAEHLKENRPRRHMLLVWFDNQARGHAGASAFYRALEDDNEDHKVEARIESWEEEIDFIAKLSALANSEDPLDAEANVRDRLAVVEHLKKRGAKEFRDGKPYKKLVEKGDVEDLDAIRSQVDAFFAEVAPLKATQLQELNESLVDGAERLETFIELQTLFDEVTAIAQSLKKAAETKQDAEERAEKKIAAADKDKDSVARDKAISARDEKLAEAKKIVEKQKKLLGEFISGLAGKSEYAAFVADLKKFAQQLETAENPADLNTELTTLSAAVKPEAAAGLLGDITSFGTTVETDFVKIEKAGAKLAKSSGKLSKKSGKLLKKDNKKSFYGAARKLAASCRKLAEKCLKEKARLDKAAPLLAAVAAGNGGSAWNEDSFEAVVDVTLTEFEKELDGIRKVRTKLFDRLSDKGKERAYEVKDREYKLRDEILGYTKKYGTEEKPENVTKRIAEINEILEKETGPIKLAWNDLLRTIGKLRRQFSGKKPEALSAEVQKNLEIVLASVNKDLRLRKDELDFEKTALDADLGIKKLIGKQWICLHSALLLGDTSDTWGLVIGGESAMHSSQDNPGLYGKIQNVFLRAYESIGGKDGSKSHFLPESANQDLPQTRVLWASPFLIHSGEVAGLFGIYNLAIGTAQEGLVREGTPDDTLANLAIDTIENQIDDIANFISGPDKLPESGDGSLDDIKSQLSVLNDGLKLIENSDDSDEAKKAARKAQEEKIEDFLIAHPNYSAIANQDGLSLRRGIVASKEYVTPSFEDVSVHGPMVMGLLPGSSIPNTPMPGATVQFRLHASYSLAYNPVKPAGFDNFQILRTTRNGVYSIGPVSGGWVWRVRGGFAGIFDKQGIIRQVSDFTSYKSVRWRLNVLRVNAGLATLPPQLRTDRLPGEEVHILSARSNADLDPKKAYYETADGLVSWYSGEREKGVKLFSLRQFVGLNNGPEILDTKTDAGNPIGSGFSMVGNPPAFDVPMRSASDLWRLNESRLAILRSKGIQDSSLAELHGRSEDILNEAGEESSPLRRESLATSSFWASRPVYTKVRSMLDDLVFAVLILLGLSVPFAFALERVIIGGATIYKQICWFCAFFAITFFILYLSHPAFAIANTPIIIFLGFAILVMSVMVICIIMRKFEVELKALQGMTATVHATDVSSISTFMAAMHMGISTMRRRPMRTALTAITIILLTFTILCFASFGTQSGIVTLSTAPNPSYSGIFIHNVNWNPLSQDLAEIVKGRWRDRVAVCRRFWVSPKTQDNPGLLASLPDGSKPVTIRGILGVDSEEFKNRPDMVELFGGIDDNSLIITSAVARTLGVDVGDEVLLKGRKLKVSKLMDAVRVSASKDMDASSILPADFTEASSTQQNADSEEDAELMTQRNWASLPVDSVAIVSADVARSLGASLHGIMVYTEDTTEAVELAEELARVLPFPIAATRENGVFRHILGTVMKASGAKDLFFPILLGGLVIFGTMLGSVADRQKEIYTFSALGLAPKHVATLFFAESMVYSLIGGLGGYLLAQGTVKILGVLNDHGLVRVPEMNMSSTNTIVTILLVMVTVLISAIYPAVKASKSANPGLMRMWRPPEPNGDLLDLVFPFTVSAYDITGVVSFLKEHFGNHTDTGLGQFMTSNVQLAKDSDGSLGLDANLALAPFDLGVSQTFALRSAPSEIPGIDEVRVILKRLSGQPKDWRRLNKVFLDDLRQQFLIWRSIPHETMELYRERTLTALGSDADGQFAEPKNNTPSEDA